MRRKDIYIKNAGIAPDKFKRQRRINTVTRIISQVVIIGVVLAIFFMLCVNYVFIIDSIEITGSGQYTDEEIIRACGISPGDKLYGFNAGKLENKAMYELPYINSLKVKRQPPSKLILEIAEDSGVYAFYLGGDVYITSGKFRVLTRAGSGMERDGALIYITTDRIDRCFVGREIEFADIDIKNIIADLRRLIAEHGAEDLIGEIDLSDKFGVVLVYDGRINIKINGIGKMDVKFAFAMKNIERIPAGDSGVLEIMSEDEASFKKY